MANVTWTYTPTITTVTLPDGTLYYLKDKEAREYIEDIYDKITTATHWLGVTTTSLYDGATTNPITIGGESVTAVSGDIAQISGSEFIFNGTAWQELGTSVGTLKAFAQVDKGKVTVAPKIKGTPDVVLGADTTFTAGTSSVTFGTPTTATVLKSDVTATVPKPSATTKYLSATASGTEVNAPTAAAITGLGTPTTKKLATTTVPNVTSGGTAASWSATVANENLTFNWATNVPATLGTAITVATGSLGTSGSGGSVVTGYGTPSTANFVTGVTVSAEPEVSLTAGTTTSTGAVPYVSALGTSGTNAVTFATSGHTASAITDLPTATAAAQTITVGTNDKVTVVKNLGSSSATNTYTGVEETYEVNPKPST